MEHFSSEKVGTWNVKSQDDQMKCPKCGRFDLKEADKGISCRVCGYTLTPGESDRFRLYKLLKEEEKNAKRR